MSLSYNDRWQERMDTIDRLMDEATRFAERAERAHTLAKRADAEGGERKRRAVLYQMVAGRYWHRMEMSHGSAMELRYNVQ